MILRILSIYYEYLGNFAIGQNWPSMRNVETGIELPANETDMENK